MQILRISRALVQDTNIILFDDPTSNLDLKNTRRIKDLLFKLKEMNKRIIVSTHDINFANSISDIIFMIKNGKVIYSGDKKEILNKNNIIDCYDLNDYDSEDIRLF